VATGLTSSVSAISDFLDGVPWKDLEDVSKVEADFFQPGMILL
jgi:hypothetical protein